MGSICDRIADDEKQEDERLEKLRQAVCEHKGKKITKHYTYGWAWLCPECGKRGEDWWD